MRDKQHAHIKVLLGGADAVDPIILEETQSGADATSFAFNVRSSMTPFQLLMRVSEHAVIEFIARGTSGIVQISFNWVVVL